MNRPVIGVMPLVDEEKNSLWMLNGYFDSLTLAGGLPIMLPLTSDRDVLRQVFDICDGLLFSGGHDVSPEIYGERSVADNNEFCEKRDRMESILLSLSLEEDKPLLGICRGIQFINAYLGGTLYQDLPTQRPTGVKHHQDPPYDEPAHEVTIIEGTPLSDLLKTDALKVNSYHHQAVKTIAPPLKAMAVSEDGLIEAVFHPGQTFLWAIQWHPEFSFKTDKSSEAIVREFVSKAGEGHE